MAKACIKKGGKVFYYESSTGEKLDPPAEEVVQNNPVPVKEVVQESVTTNYTINSDINLIKKDDTIGRTKLALMQGIMNTYTAAKVIVSEMRSCYFLSVGANITSYDLEILSYLDKILFDPLMDIVDGIIKYGAKGIDVNFLYRIVDNAINVVDYQSDISSIHYIVDRVYEEFA